MSDVMGGGGGNGEGPGKNNNWDIWKGFCKNSAVWAVGGAACFLRYKSMQTIIRQNMVARGPAYTFVFIYGVVNYQLYRQALRQVKSNAKEAYKQAKEKD